MVQGAEARSNVWVELGCREAAGWGVVWWRRQWWRLPKRKRDHQLGSRILGYLTFYLSSLDLFKGAPMIVMLYILGCYALR